MKDVILNHMAADVPTERSPEQQEVIDEQMARERARESEEKRLKKLQQTERQAERSLKVFESKKNDPQSRVDRMDTSRLIEEYDHWERLQRGLKKSDNHDLQKQVDKRLEEVRRELRDIRGVEVETPEVTTPHGEMAGLSLLPSAYSAELLNNLTQSALGITIQKEKGLRTDQISSDGKTVRVPSGTLTIEDTVRIAQELGKANPDLLVKRREEIRAFGQNIRELASYLSSLTEETKDGKRRVFDARQGEALVELYNAGIWLEKLGKPTVSLDKATDWVDMQKKGDAFAKAMENAGPEEQRAKKTKLVEFILGKTDGKGPTLTSYQRLREHFKTDEEFQKWLTRMAPWLLKHFAPSIAESFVEGEVSKNITRGVVRGARNIVTQTIFEQARERAKEGGRVSLLPPAIEKQIRERYGEAAIPDTRNLAEAARRIVAQEKNPQKQLEALNDLVRHYQIPGEVQGEKIKGYTLAEAYANPEAELGCAVRAYLLAAVLQEAYKDLPQDKRPIVLANTMLVPIEKTNGQREFIGHTRLQVMLPNAQAFTVDPSVLSYLGSGVRSIEDVDTLMQLWEYGKTGRNGIVFEMEGGDVLSRYQWIGDAFESQEANMLVNLAGNAKSETDQRKMLQMALQKDPNNIIALAHLAALSPEGEKRDTFIERIEQKNPLIDKGDIRQLLHLASEKKLRVELAADTFQDPGLNQIVADFYASQGIPRGTNLATLPYSQTRLDALLQLRSDLDQALTNLQAQNSPNYPTDRQHFQQLVDMGDPRRGVSPNPNAEIGKALLNMEERRQQSPDVLWRRAQDFMMEIEGDEKNPSGYANLEGNKYAYTQGLSREIEQAILQAKKDGRWEDMNALKQLASELRVRSAAHDVVVIASLEGEPGANKMGQYGNRISTTDLELVESLPGVAEAKQMYEQEENYILAMNGGITTSDFEAIEKRVRKRILRAVNEGTITFKYDQQTNAELFDYELNRAVTVGRNLLVFTNRDAHFVALGSPDVMGGLGIGNTRLDFVVRALSPGWWGWYRWGQVNPHLKELVEYLGKDEIDRWVYLQDFSSAIWRIPVFLDALEKFEDPISGRRINLRTEGKQGLIMQLYWLGETTLTPDQVPSQGVGGQDVFLQHHTQAELAAERLRLVKDIIHYEPEELVSIFRDHHEIKALFGDAATSEQYYQFIQDMQFVRQRCLKEGDYNFTHFDDYLATFPQSQAMYGRVTKFLSQFEENLADPDWKFTFKHKHDPKESDKAHLASVGRVNPLFRQRVYSLVDMPFQLIYRTKGQITDQNGDVYRDANGNPVIGDVANKIIVDGFAGQTVGRELGNISGALQAVQVIGEYLNTHPSLELVEKMAGKIWAWKGYSQDFIVRDAMMRGVIKWRAEYKGLRALMPGLDGIIGRMIGGASLAQKETGRWGPADQSQDLGQLLLEAIEHGAISHHAKEELQKEVTGALPLLYALAWLPQLQLMLFMTLANMIKTAADAKALVG